MVRKLCFGFVSLSIKASLGFLPPPASNTVIQVIQVGLNDGHRGGMGLRVLRNRAALCCGQNAAALHTRKLLQALGDRRPKDWLPLPRLIGTARPRETDLTKISQQRRLCEASGQV